MKVPFVYLGILVGANFRRVDTWKPVVEKISRKLASWKHKLLSFGGRVCLIKLVLSSMPMFCFSLHKVPTEVINEIAKL